MVGVPWLPGAEQFNTNEIASRKCFEKIKQKLRRNEDLKIKYEKIIHEYLEQGMVKKAPEQPTGPSIFYMPHKPVVKRRGHNDKSKDGFWCQW